MLYIYIESDPINSKTIFYSNFSTGVYLLLHIRYDPVTLVFILSVVQTKYSDTRYMYWGVWLFGTTLQNTDIFFEKFLYVLSLFSLSFQIFVFNPCLKGGMLISITTLHISNDRSTAKKLIKKCILY